MAVGPDAVKSPTFPPPPAELATVLENAFTRAPQDEFSGAGRVPALP